MNKLIIANWKMNPETIKEAVSMAKEIDSENLVICPPFTFIAEVSRAVKKSILGAQDLFWEDNGAHTGEISGSQLYSLGVKYVIIGHSERRRHLRETDEMVAKKVAAALRNGLIPILCVGETQEERNRNQTQKVVERQLKIGLSLIGNCPPEADPPLAEKLEIVNLIVAYEPVWAISTSKDSEPDTPENAVQMINFIKKQLEVNNYKLKIDFIYGGSVNAQTAEKFLKEKEIQGVLVGGASLKSKEFKKIIDIARKYE